MRSKKGFIIFQWNILDPPLVFNDRYGPVSKEGEYVHNSQIHLAQKICVLMLFWLKLKILNVCTKCLLDMNVLVQKLEICVCFWPSALWRWMLGAKSLLLFPEVCSLPSQAARDAYFRDLSPSAEVSSYPVNQQPASTPSSAQCRAAWQRCRVMMRTRRSLAGFPSHQAQNKGGPGLLGCSKYSLQHAPSNCLTRFAFTCIHGNSVDAGIDHGEDVW